jgi:hypothetical protein
VNGMGRLTFLEENDAGGAGPRAWLLPQLSGQRLMLGLFRYSTSGSGKQIWSLYSPPW